MRILSFLIKRTNVFYLFVAFILLFSLSYRLREKFCRRPWVVIGKRISKMKEREEGENHMVLSGSYRPTARWPCALQIKGRHRRIQSAHRSTVKELLISCQSAPPIPKVALQITRPRKIAPPRIPSGLATCSESEMRNQKVARANIHPEIRPA